MLVYHFNITYMITYCDIINIIAYYNIIKIVTLLLIMITSLISIM